MTAAMIGTGILFFPDAPVFLFMRGKDVMNAKGKPVVSYVNGNTELQMANFQALGKAAESASALAATTAAPVEVPAPRTEPTAAPTTPPERSTVRPFLR